MPISSRVLRTLIESRFFAEPARLWLNEGASSVPMKCVAVSPRRARFQVPATQRHGGSSASGFSPRKTIFLYVPSPTFACAFHTVAGFFADVAVVVVAIGLALAASMTASHAAHDTRARNTRIRRL